MLNRKIILKKLTDYLEGRLTKEQAHSWALACAVSDEYATVSKSDALIAITIQSLIDVDREKHGKTPSRRALEYYRLCLKGEMVFDPLNMDLRMIGEPDPKHVPEPKPQKSLPAQKPQEKPQRKRFRFSLLSRVYVVSFAICSLLFQLTTLMNPSFMEPGQVLPTNDAVLIETLPHIFYAVILLIPPRMFASGVLFLLVLPVMFAGLVFYLYISFTMVMKLSLNMLLVVAVLPFGALPALLALCLLIKARKDHK